MTFNLAHSYTLDDLEVLGRTTAAFATGGMNVHYSTSREHLCSMERSSSFVNRSLSQKHCIYYSNRWMLPLSS